MIGLSDKEQPSGRDWAVVYGLDAVALGVVFTAPLIPAPWATLAVVFVGAPAILLSVFTAVSWWQMRGAPAPRSAGAVPSRSLRAVEGRPAPIRVKASVGPARPELPSKVG